MNTPTKHVCISLPLILGLGHGWTMSMWADNTNPTKCGLAIGAEMTETSLLTCY